MSEISIRQVCLGLFDAAVEPVAWPIAIGKLADYMDAGEGTLNIWSKYPERPVIIETAQRTGSSDALRAYTDLYCSGDKAREYIARSAPGIPHRCSEIISSEDVDNLPFYQDYYLGSRYGLHGRWSMGVKLFETADHIAILAVHRGPHRQEFNVVDVERFQEFYEEGRRAAKVFMKSVAENMQARCGVHVLNAYVEPALAVEADGRIAQLNDHAKRMLATRTPLRAAFGMLKLHRKADEPLMMHILKETAAMSCGNVADGTPKLRAMTLMKEYGFPSAILCAQPIVPDTSGRFLPSVAQPSVLLRVVFPLRNRDYAAEVVGSLYKLTEAEIRVVSGVASGLALAEIANANPAGSTSVRTAEHQLGAALRKTGTKNQLELTRLVREIERPS